MKISILALLIFSAALFTTVTSCNKGYGCKATESMKASGPSDDGKKGIFGGNKPRSGLME